MYRENDLQIHKLPTFEPILNKFEHLIIFKLSHITINAYYDVW